MIVEKEDKKIDFTHSCKSILSDGYKLTQNSGVTPFGLVFAIFNYKLFGAKKYLRENSKFFTNLLIKNIDLFKKKRASLGKDLRFDKSYLQLLTFTLSSLSILDQIENYPLANHTKDLYKGISTSDYLNRIKAFEGKPGSGNFSMFYSIISIHNQHFFSNSNDNIEIWLNLHIKNLNKNGFWGKNSQNPYIQFQNGYHQYEIFDYLDIGGDFWEKAANFTFKLADKNGHFAPYPGGGGCYDYDAVFFLTSRFVDKNKYKSKLFQLYNSIINDLNNDGGFAETIHFRPFNKKRIKCLIKFLLRENPKLFFPKLQFLKSLLRPRNHKIYDDWTTYKRSWDQSDLWNTWFKNLTLLRISNLKSDTYNSKNHLERFINYPGLGYYWNLNKKIYDK